MHSNVCASFSRPHKEFKAPVALPSSLLPAERERKKKKRKKNLAVRQDLKPPAIGLLGDFSQLAHDFMKMEKCNNAGPH